MVSDVRLLAANHNYTGYIRTYTSQAFRAEYFTLIHPDLENYDSPLEKVLLFLWIMDIA